MLGFIIIVVTGRLGEENWGSEIKVKRMVFVIAFEEVGAEPEPTACWVRR